MWVQQKKKGEQLTLSNYLNIFFKYRTTLQGKEETFTAFGRKTVGKREN